MMTFPRTDKKFPVMWTDNRVSKPGPTSIPWSVADKAYSVYVARYGAQQSLELLAQRGGFYATELDDFLSSWREEASEVDALRAEVAQLNTELAARLRVSIDAITAGLESYARGWAECREAAAAIRRECSEHCGATLDEIRALSPPKIIAIRPPGEKP